MLHLSPATRSLYENSETSEIFFFNTRREIMYLQVTMQCPIYYTNINDTK